MTREKEGSIQKPPTSCREFLNKLPCAKPLQSICNDDEIARQRSVFIDPSGFLETWFSWSQTSSSSAPSLPIANAYFILASFFIKSFEIRWTTATQFTRAGRNSRRLLSPSSSNSRVARESASKTCNFFACHDQNCEPTFSECQAIALSFSFKYDPGDPSMKFCRIGETSFCHVGFWISTMRFRSELRECLKSHSCLASSPICRQPNQSTNAFHFSREKHAQCSYYLSQISPKIFERLPREAAHQQISLNLWEPVHLRTTQRIYRLVSAAPMHLFSHSTIAMATALFH